MMLSPQVDLAGTYCFTLDPPDVLEVVVQLIVVLLSCISSPSRPAVDHQTYRRVPPRAPEPIGRIVRVSLSPKLTLCVRALYLPSLPWPGRYVLDTEIQHDPGDERIDGRDLVVFALSVGAPRCERSVAVLVAAKSEQATASFGAGGAGRRALREIASGGQGWGR